MAAGPSTTYEIPNTMESPRKCRKIDEETLLRLIDEIPESAQAMADEQKLKAWNMKRINFQAIINNYVKSYLDPYYLESRITKEEYKRIFTQAFDKIYYYQKGVVPMNTVRIKQIIVRYVKRAIEKRKECTCVCTCKEKK